MPTGEREKYRYEGHDHIFTPRHLSVSVNERSFNQEFKCHALVSFMSLSKPIAVFIVKT